MKTSVWERRIYKPGHRKHQPNPRIFCAAFMILAIAASTGCSILKNFIPVAVSPPPATSAPIEPPTETAIPDSPTIPPSYTPEPTFTELPTYTPLPTYTLLPTYPPLPTYTLFPSLTPEIFYFPPSPYPTYPSYASGQCCTLRVRNLGKVTYWIGTRTPYGGNYIKPLWYVEFYMHQPTYMWIEWCRVKSYSHTRYDCKKKYVYLDENLKEISVP